MGIVNQCDQVHPCSSVSVRVGEYTPEDNPGEGKAQK